MVIVSPRPAWVKLHPPNHAGYYFCHICGGWVHEDAAELDHIIPASVERIDMDEPGWDDKLRMAHAWPQTRADGTVYCIGNRGKGSIEIVSATLEIAPGDESW